MEKKLARLIAFYLPQYHPIPENDEWWGRGFTEWTNVAKGKPLFKGHYQPHIPADLGYYDLRVPEVRQAQADLARQYGIEGFCYWHYWFAGKQLLERPFSEVLQSGNPKFPFCLAWANQSWSGIWHGAPDRILIEQTYPGLEDHKAHFKALLPAFNDERYITVDRKPIFLIYKPKYLPNPKATLELWKDLAIKAGLAGLYVVGVINEADEGLIFKNSGFDAFTISRVPWPNKENDNIFYRFMNKRMGNRRMVDYYQKILHRPYHIYDFKRVAPHVVVKGNLNYEYYPCVIPNWDNSPRSGINGYVGINSTPELFKNQIKEALDTIKNNTDEHKIIFIKSWNEWAEGNYLEPDQLFGVRFLEMIPQAISENK